MADKKYRDLFNFFKDGGEKTVGTTLRGDMYRQNVWTFGRNPDCDFVYSAPKISREHCRVQLIDGHFYISDMGSTNGTYLNGKLVRRKERIFSGDVIGIGDEDIVFTKSMLT